MTKAVIRDERGAAIVEAAIGSMVVFFLIFLIFQGALFARAYLAASDAATAGSRVGGVAAQDPLADYDILKAVATSMSAGSHDQVHKVVVFRALGPDFAVPESCYEAPGANCNHYSGDDLSVTESTFLNSAFAKDDYWPASTRTAANEKIGVYVEFASGGVGGPLPQSVSNAAIARIETG